jgi:hypothetical protein
VVDVNLNMKAIKIGNKIPLPANAEQLRRRLTVMGTAWFFVASNNTSRGYLKGLEMHLWTEYANHLLGKFVLGMLGGEDGAATSPGDWTIILNYDQEVRRDMISRMQKGTPISPALREAMSCPVVKDRYLVTPLQQRTLGRKRPNDNAWQPPTRKPKGGKEKGAGKGQEKGGKDNKKTPGCKGKNAKGERICFAFNNQKEGCTVANCTYAHCCGVCFKQKTPMFECNRKSS